MMLPVRGTGRLRKGRISSPGARYFVTLCTRQRANSLAQQNAAARMENACRRLDEDQDIALIAMTIMPDHVHVLFELRERLSLAKVLSKMKGLGRDPRASWQWQENVFEHRLRAEECVDTYCLYLFLNPYRAGLIPIDASWPWWRYNPIRAPAFIEQLTSNGGPPPEWLAQPECLPPDVAHH